MDKVFKAIGTTKPAKIYLDIYAEETSGSDKKGGKKHFLERWCIESNDKTKDSPLSTKQQEELNQHLPAAYRKSIVLIRSLFSYVLLLPSYELFQKLQKHRTGMGFTLNFSLSHVESYSIESSK